MSSIKVSALTAKTTPAGTEELLINDSGVSKKITIANLPDTNTTYSVGDGGLTEVNFTTADNSKLDAIEASATADQTAGEIEAIVTHDNLLGFVANEHIDWTTDQGATNIHAGNYTDTNTTYSEGDGGLTQKNFTTTLKDKLDGIATAATANGTVTGSGTTSGTNTGDNTVCTSGTATTAATLATARTIAGVSFDGSANISLNNNAITNGAGYTTNVGDITGVTAGTGMSGGGTSGTVTLTCTIDSPSEVGLGNLSSSGNALSGSFTATGNITAYSDLRLKTEIETIDSALEKVLDIRGVTFTMNDERGTGVIAQELEQVLPEAVFDNEDGMKSVAYGNIVGLLIEAIKELSAKVEKLENK